MRATGARVAPIIDENKVNAPNFAGNDSGVYGMA